ncbi:hypothetical protein [Brevibacterium casei]|uniref:hypothetical protein n=1 Tax=Brevibacterium casei TaxID=33889 RepID=UPI00241E6805|nr:hypothetical protein [Brevibacterium casei]
MVEKATIVVGDSDSDAVAVTWRAEEIRALHHTLFDCFENNGPGLRVTLHIGSDPVDVERHYFLTPDRPVHFVYANGKLPDLNEELVKAMKKLIDLGEAIHMPFAAGVEHDVLAQRFILGGSPD